MEKRKEIDENEQVSQDAKKKMKEMKLKGEFQCRSGADQE